ncbi:bromodomain-containing protein 3 [Drosophila kikkawai]|uniref:Bromodomain-containing protein 3 n=1 Tax=Drosophila kikkawai TaxID=30033 RepID=A0A6P4HTC9_DROKI|nr:bromodomain-containing protein 3 isoform X1 [Drosophila kikkawai]
MDDNEGSEEIQACQAIMTTLLSSSHKKVAWVFYEPLNADLLRLHDYHDIVKEPMDLSTVKHRLDTGVYQTCTEFAKDMRLIFYNTYLYTPPNHLCHVMAKKLELIFEALYAKVHRTYADGSNPKDETPSSSSSVSAKAALSAYEKDEPSTAAVTPFREDADSFDWSLSGSYSTQEHDSLFTAEEDFDLHAKIQQLDGEVLLHVIHLVQRMEGAAYGNKELEFDIRQLKVQTKRSIQEYLASKGITGKRMPRTTPRYC